MLFCIARMNARGTWFGGKRVENGPGEGLIPQQRVCSEGGSARGLQEGSDAGMRKDSELLASKKKITFLVL